MSASQDNSVPAINMTDPNIASARTAPSVVTNSAGAIKTAEPAKARDHLRAQNILLLG